ncbi:MAG: adenylyl-sulfate kinase [Chitinophagaceae bacterium]
MSNIMIDPCGCAAQMDQKGKALWFTGLSGAGKTTLAKALHERFKKNKIFCVILDGDELRQTINAGLGFSSADRSENIRRIAEIARLMVNNGIICIISTISPYPELRANAKQIIGEEHFSEIFINAPLAVCEERDVKGLYKKARQNKIGSFTGVHDEYTPPESPDLEILTDVFSIEESVEKIYNWYLHLVPAAPVEV